MHWHVFSLIHENLVVSEQRPEKDQCTQHTGSPFHQVETHQKEKHLCVTMLYTKTLYNSLDCITTNGTTHCSQYYMHAGNRGWETLRTMLSTSLYSLILMCTYAVAYDSDMLYCQVLDYGQMCFWTKLALWQQNWSLYNSEKRPVHVSLQGANALNWSILWWPVAMHCSSHRAVIKVVSN